MAWLCTHTHTESLPATLCVRACKCSFMSLCNTWEQKKTTTCNRFIFHHLVSCLAHPLLIAPCMLGKHWLILGFLQPNFPSGAYLVHAKLKLIHIWASCDLAVLIDLRLQRGRKSCEGCIIAKSRGWREMRKTRLPSEMIKQTVTRSYDTDLNLRTMDKQEHLSSRALSSP